MRIDIGRNQSVVVRPNGRLDAASSGFVKRQLVALMRAGFASRSIIAILKKWDVEEEMLSVLESEGT